MPRKRHKPEEIVVKLRHVDVLVAQGKPVADANGVLATRNMTAERARAAALDRRHHVHLGKAHMAAVGVTPSGALIAEDTRSFTASQIAAGSAASFFERLTQVFAQP